MLLDIKVNNQWYRFRRSWWSNGTYELTCISEEPTDVFNGRRFTKEQLKQGMIKGTVKIANRENYENLQSIILVGKS